MEKKPLRKKYLELRNSLGSADRGSRSEAIAGRFLDSFPPEDRNTYHFFLSIVNEGEVDTEPLIEAVRKLNSEAVICVPRLVRGAREFENVILGPESELAENSWGIREPVGGELLGPERFDLVAVPLLCFDTRGHRVGYGGGYYDAFLAKTRPDCVKVGVSFFPPIEKIEGITDRDVPLDACVTPDRIWRFDEE